MQSNFVSYIIWEGAVLPRGWVAFSRVSTIRDNLGTEAKWRHNGPAWMSGLVWGRFSCVFVHFLAKSNMQHCSKGHFANCGKLFPPLKWETKEESCENGTNSNAKDSYCSVMLIVAPRAAHVSLAKSGVSLNRAAEREMSCFSSWLWLVGVTFIPILQATKLHRRNQRFFAKLLIFVSNVNLRSDIQ